MNLSRDARSQTQPRRGLRRVEAATRARRIARSSPRARCICSRPKKRTKKSEKCPTGPKVRHSARKSAIASSAYEVDKR